jgi:hypothetical protein
VYFEAPPVACTHNGSVCYAGSNSASSTEVFEEVTMPLPIADYALIGDCETAASSERTVLWIAFVGRVLIPTPALRPCWGRPNTVAGC